MLTCWEYEDEVTGNATRVTTGLHARTIHRNLRGFVVGEETRIDGVSRTMVSVYDPRGNLAERDGLGRIISTREYDDDAHACTIAGIDPSDDRHRSRQRRSNAALPLI